MIPGLAGQPTWSTCGPDLLAACQRVIADLREQNMTGLCSRSRDEQIADLRAAIAKAERSADGQAWLRFLHVRHTKNWVLARRTPRIVARYGDDVVCLTAKQLDQAEADYLNGKAP